MTAVTDPVTDSVTTRSDRPPLARPAERDDEASAAAAHARRVRRPAAGARAAGAGAAGRDPARRAARPRPAVRPARARQDQPRHDHRRGAGRALRITSGPGAGAGRRPRRDAVQPRRGRRAVHRRDPPDRPPRRGDALPRDGGLPRRRRGRQGPRRHQHPAGDRAVHAGRRHHPVRLADRAAARPVRLHRAHGVLRAPSELEQVLRRSAAILGIDLRADGAEEIAGRSRGTPRIANRLLRRVRDFAEVRADGAVTRDGRPGRAARSTTSTSSGSTASTGPCSARSCARSAAARSACRRWLSRWARSQVRWRRCASRTWCGPGMLARHSAGSGRDRGGLGASGARGPELTLQASCRLPCSRVTLRTPQSELTTSTDGEKWTCFPCF